ncbi:MAG TPA: anaerobic ribonucleoside-triphosphate reductase activating protein [Firmicutes bacterium]|nr:anaerobic ribonucleoside-triphosphate reductase activating protein [Bacillota bacterium]
MDIRGIQKISFIDFPGEICATLFAGGCNFKCRYCHNKDLVLKPADLPPIQENEIIKFLKAKKYVLDGVCISGGEPSLQEGLPDFISRIKELDLKVKLDTNGTRPYLISKLLDRKLIDYIAMDIKAPLEKYSFVTGVDVDIERLKETINLLKSNSIDQEFRTTVVPGLLNENDILSIARLIAGSKKYVLQQFRPGASLIDPALSDVKLFYREQVARVADSCKEYIQEVQLRGF